MYAALRMIPTAWHQHEVARFEAFKQFVKLADKRNQLGTAPHSEHELQHDTTTHGANSGLCTKHELLEHLSTTKNKKMNLGEKNHHPYER